MTPPLILKQIETAEFFDIPIDTFKKWYKGGRNPDLQHQEKKGGEILFNIQEVHKFIVRKKEEEAERKATQKAKRIVTDDEKELRLRKLQAETQIAEADAEKALGNVVLVEDIKKRDEGLFDALRAGVIQIPSKLCSEMAIENDPNVIQAEFKEIINNLLLSFQKSVISYAEDIKKQVE